jgi:predicted AAA+ superfamily ATPase
MEIKRDIYLNRLIKRKNNSLAKVITGIRRCGKSYLLFELYKKHLIKEGVSSDHIIEVNLDSIENRELRDALNLYSHVKSLLVDNDDNDPFYVFLDEIQYVEGFADMVNSLLRMSNRDNIKAKCDSNGILTMGLLDFLLNQDSLAL